MNNSPLPIGTYDPHATNDVAYNYIDKYNLAVFYGGNGGIGDSIGRTMTFYMTYNDPKLIEGIENLWQFRPEFKNKMVGIRHPDILNEEVQDRYAKGYWKNRMSRDHYIYTLVALRLHENNTYYKSRKLEEIVRATPFNIRRMARWTLPLILWSKSLKGNKFALWLYLVLELLMTNLIYIPVRKLGYKLTGWKPEVDQDEWGWTNDIDPWGQSEEWKHDHLLQSQPKWKQTISRIVFPSYAILFGAHQLYVTPNTFPKLKAKLQKSLLKMVGETNYVQRMLLGEKNIPREKIESYRTMYGGRWSGHLNGRNDRHMAIMTDGKFTINLIDEDLVKSLYNQTQLS